MCPLGVGQLHLFSFLKGEEKGLCQATLVSHAALRVYFWRVRLRTLRGFLAAHSSREAPALRMS